jgi:hypothetical protein
MPAPKIDAAYFIKESERLQADYESKVEKLAERVRKALVMPLCKKYNLRFTSGNGSFSFDIKDRKSYDISGIIIDADDADRVGFDYEEFAECFEALNAEVNAGRHNVGMWCQDVDNGPGTEVE